jgi:hypothetical protein
MVSAAGAAQAQQAARAPATQQQATPSVAKPDNSQKVTCRVQMDGNLPRRTCMKNSDWAKLDSQNQNGLDSSYVNRARCSSLGAC